MQYKIEYDIDFSGLKDFVSVAEVRLKNASETKKAIQSMGIYAQQELIKTASTKFSHSKGDYARGILEGGHYPFNNDDLFFMIIHPSKIAYWLEKGTEPFDMKKILWTSDKVRMSKQGTRYLIIPFEHGTPGSKTKNAMPKHIYQAATNLRQSVITGTYKEGSIRTAINVQDAELLRKYNPNKVKRFTYKWGDRLETDEAKYQGMVRFQRNVNLVNNVDLGKFAGVNKTSNLQNYSSYMTFRVMSENSQGWLNPGIKPMFIFKETKDRIKGSVTQTIAEAAKKDLNNIFAKN